MLEYFHTTTLQLLSEIDLREWLGVSQPHDYLTLLRTAKLLTYCPTSLARPGYAQWLVDPDDRKVLNAEFGLPPNTTMFELRQKLQTYLDESLKMYACTYSYNNTRYVVAGELTARKLWQFLNRHGQFLIVTVDPITLHLNCRYRFENFSFSS